MPKLWIDKKLYSVEGEVRDYADALEEENAKLKEALENLINNHPGQLHKNKPTTLQEAERALKG